jgi:protocatechuate 3,4-dioxygenase beta subunit
LNSKLQEEENMVQLTKALTYAFLTATVLAHPGGDVRKEVLAREEALRDPERRTLQHCARELERNGHYQDLIEQRMAKANALRAELGYKPVSPSVKRSFLRSRDVGAVISPRDETTDEDIFAERASCVLDPEQTEGPYWVEGELVRQDLLEGSKGVIINLDINIIDTTTCKPVTNAYAEMWGCNSTGVYTGVVAKGNGAGPAAPQEINNSALRGIQPTNSNGTAVFKTMIPGHYVGRPNHLHTIIHHGATLLPNNTLAGGTISHVGQFYFDQNFLATVEKTSPYSTNKQALTLNANDMLFRQAKGNGDDPIVKIVLLGNTVEEGVYGWIDVGVRPTQKYSPKAVNKWTAKGGVPIAGSPWAGYPWTKKRDTKDHE